MPAVAQPLLVSGRLCLELSVAHARLRNGVAEEHTYWQHGGTGGHMAVTAARLGAPVALCAHAGRTAHDDDIVATLIGEGVDVSGIIRRTAHRAPAYLHSDRRRDTQPVTVSSSVAPTLDAEDVDRIESLLLSHAWLLVDAALPGAFLEELIARASLYGLFVILCLVQAPGDHVPRRVWEHVDFLVTNVSSVELLARRGLWPVAAGADAALLCRALGSLRGALVLRGAETLSWADRATSACLPLDPPRVVHVRGAGAVAAGALAVALAEQRPLPEAAHLVRETIAFYVSHEGTRAAMPLRRELSHHVAK
jgi:ribokinase